MTTTTLDHHVRLTDGLLLVDGRPRVLLCASLFYFRLPRSQWRARLEQVRASGYTSVDVYLPWNFHETEPGTWDFTGERDVAAFLDLAAEVGLLVVARPGPYICSEWDGGALPAWLTLTDGLRVRQHEPRFLEHVRRWFDQVGPLLAARQLGDPLGTGARGTVALVQVENELDFFDCEDRTAYVGSLRDMLVAHGISVPVVACSGQGDLQGATGDVDGVVPACNFYPDDSSPAVETEVLHYTRELASRGLPLLVTETNRRHVTLRRLLVSGARLLAPYLQASGYNFGATPSVGNWGDPGSLMAHDYDFAGYVSPEGTERPEFLQAQLLARVVETLGPRLAAASPTDGPATEVQRVGFTTADHLAALDLEGGGRLVGLPNLSGAAGTAVLRAPGGPVEVVVGADRCALVLVDLPLAAWGRQATLALATADLVGVRETVGGLLLELASDSPTTVVLAGCGEGATVDGRPTGDLVRLHLGPDAPSAVVTTADGRVVVSVVPVSEATRHSAAVDTRAQADETGTGGGAGASTLDARTARSTTAHLWADAPVTTHDDGAPPLEALGVHRGRGRFRTTVDVGTAQALLLVGASDIVDLRLDHVPLPTVARFGAAHLVDLAHLSGTVDVTADVEIWGHSNFDDSRLPALRLGSLRGVGEVFAVTAADDVTAGWVVSDGDRARATGEAAGEISPPDGPTWPGHGPGPLRTLGGWSSTRISAPVTYTRTVARTAGPRAALRLDGLVRPVEVSVDGGPDVVVHPADPWLVLPTATSSGDEPAPRTVSITWPHDPDAGGLRAQVLTLSPLTCWDARPLPERQLDAQAAHDRHGDTVDLPVDLGAGEDLWLDVDVPASPTGRRIRLSGRQVRVTAWLDGRSLGRVWLGDDARPVVTGGDPEALWTPETATDGVLTLLLHGTAGGPPPRLDGVALSAP